jgi:ferredoxin
MPLDTFKTRVPENVPGKFYVGDQCMDCDLCRGTAPEVFARNDEGGYSYVKKQPETTDELKRCWEAVAGCCTETIHADGDAFDGMAIPPDPDHVVSSGHGQRAGCCECGKSAAQKKRWWQFWK